jgi:hypothetical protein
VAEPERQGNRGAGKFRVVLIKPSQYDDDGFVVRHLVGTVPSNTLSTIHGLVHEFAVERNILGEHVETTVELYDETVRRIPVTGIIRRARKPDTRAVVWLCGVQTPQYPRAFDIARRFREAGIDVMIGGFHVSGSLAMLPIVIARSRRRANAEVQQELLRPLPLRRAGDDRRRSRLPLQVQLLHDHQCAGSKDARPQPGEHRRVDGASLRGARHQRLPHHG